jgi:hypothetical protein
MISQISSVNRSVVKDTGEMWTKTTGIRMLREVKLQFLDTIYMKNWRFLS